MATDRYGKYRVHMYESFHLYSSLTSTLERQKRHIAIVYLTEYFSMLLSASSAYVSQ